MLSYKRVTLVMGEKKGIASHWDPPREPGGHNAAEPRWKLCRQASDYPGALGSRRTQRGVALLASYWLQENRPSLERLDVPS